MKPTVPGFFYQMAAAAAAQQQQLLMAVTPQQQQQQQQQLGGAVNTATPTGGGKNNRTTLSVPSTGSVGGSSAGSGATSPDGSSKKKNSFMLGHDSARVGGPPQPVTHTSLMADAMIAFLALRSGDRREQEKIDEIWRLDTAWRTDADVARSAEVLLTDEVRGLRADILEAERALQDVDAEIRHTLPDGASWESIAGEVSPDKVIARVPDPLAGRTVVPAGAASGATTPTAAVNHSATTPTPQSSPQFPLFYSVNLLKAVKLRWPDDLFSPNGNGNGPAGGNGNGNSRQNSAQLPGQQPMMQFGQPVGGGFGGQGGSATGSAGFGVLGGGLGGGAGSLTAVSAKAPGGPGSATRALSRCHDACPTEGLTLDEALAELTVEERAVFQLLTDSDDWRFSVYDLDAACAKLAQSHTQVSSGGGGGGKHHNAAVTGGDSTATAATSFMEDVGSRTTDGNASPPQTSGGGGGSGPLHGSTPARPLGPLFYLGYCVLWRLGMLQKFSMSETTTLNWLAAVEAGYRTGSASTPFHDSLHAADVLHAVFFMLASGDLVRRQLLDPRYVLSLVLAAFAVDYDHPGYHNPVASSSLSYLSALHGLDATLERHHASSCFQLLLIRRYDILDHVAAATRQAVLRLSADLVLSTDLQRHGPLLSAIQGRLLEPMTDFTVHSDVCVILCGIIKCADAAFAARPTAHYERAVRALLHEIGAEAKTAAGYGLGPHDGYVASDLGEEGRVSMLLSFINLITLPLFATMSDCLPALRQVGELISVNKSIWAPRDSNGVSSGGGVGFFGAGVDFA
jgi:hypothetical protein